MALVDTRLKMLWAEEHFKRLRDELRVYIDETPNKFFPERYSDEKDQVWGRFKTETPVPAQFSLIFGDILHAVQCALDYLIWELAEFSKIEKPSSSNQFPIVDTQGAFEDELRRKRLRGIPSEAVSLIESFQPYHSLNGAHDSPLFALRTLANIDKHRYLPFNVLAARPAPPNIGTVEINGITYAETTDILSDPFDQEEIYGPFRLVGNQVALKTNFAIFIALSDTPYKGREITSLLSWICGSVNDRILPEFERFFT